MTWIIEWGRDPQTSRVHTTTVAGPDDLAVVLDDIEAVGVPTAVSIYRDDDDNGLQIGLGHPTHAWALIIEPRGGYASEPDVPEPNTSVEYDYNGEPTTYRRQLRITPATARQLAREYVATGRRPTAVSWDAPQHVA